MSSCNPRKIACVVESIGSFVADISVVADRKDFSHDVTSVTDSQSVTVSSREWRFLFLDMNESITSR